MILVKKRRPGDLLHLPGGIWYAWSVLLALVCGTLRGLWGVKMGWFRTPKYLRQEVGATPGLPSSARLVNIFVCLVVLCFYCLEGWAFGWRDPFAFLLVPAFVLAALK